jgi:two-component system, OmpR family, phosphate regulon sensor histidine kinase PhoR
MIKKTKLNYKSIFENSLQGIFQTTKDGKYLNVNNSLAKIYGFNSSKDLIESINNIKTQIYVDPKRRNEFIKKIKKEGKVINFESQIYKKNKEIIWISENAWPVFDNNNNKFLYFEGFVVDITKKKEAEEELKKTNKIIKELSLFNKSIIDGISDEVIVIDPFTRQIIHANKPVLERTGFNIEEIKNKRCFEIYSGKNDICNNCNLNLCINSNTKSEFEIKSFDKKTKKIIHLAVSVYPLYDDNKKIKKIVHLIKNITQRKKYEKKINNLNEQLFKLYNHSSSLQKSLDAEKTYDIAIKTFESLGFDRIRIYINIDNKLQGVKCNYIKNEIFKKIKFPIDKIYRKAYKCITTKKPTIDITSGKRIISKTLNKPKGLESASLPLVSENRVVGMISFDNYYSKKKIYEEDLMLLMTFTNQIASSIESAKYYNKNQRQVNKLSTLYDISTTISQTLDLQKILNMVVIRVVKLLKVDRCSIMLFDSSKKILSDEAVFDIKVNNPIYLNINYKEKNIYSNIFKSRTFLYIEDIKKNQEIYSKHFNKNVSLTSMLSIPLFIENNPIGIINIYTKNLKTFNNEEINLLKTLANHISIIIENSKLYERIKFDKDNFSYLLNISKEINRIHEFDKLINLSLKHTIQLTNSNYGFVLIIKNIIDVDINNDNKIINQNTENKNYELRCNIGFKKCNIDYLKNDLENLIEIVKKKKKIIISEDNKNNKEILINKDAKSYGLVPLIKNNIVLGIIYLESKKKNNYKYFIKSLGILINHISVGIENIMLYNEILNFNKHLEQKINEATKELQEKNLELKKIDQMKSDFVSNVSHELRTPLTSISGYSKLMYMEKLGDINNKQKNSLKIIVDETDRLTRLINEVLDLSKLEAGKIKINYEKFNLYECANDVITTLKSIANEKNIKLNLKKIGNDFNITAGKDLIKQVLINLLSNAIKFSFQNEKVELIIKEKDKHHEIIVKDNGKGISKEYLPRLFNKFYQIDGSLTREHGGTGLGLVIVKHIVELHKGTISVESKLGKGSKFKFILPKEVQLEK